MKNLRFQGVKNIRDFSDLVNTEGKRVKPHLFIRSNVLDKLSVSDIAVFSSDYQLTDVIDLRMTNEMEEKPDCRIYGTQYHHISLLKERTAGITHDQVADEQLAAAVVEYEPVFYEPLQGESEDTSQSLDISKAVETAVIENIPEAEETSEAEDIPEAEETPETEEIHETEETSETEEAPVIEETPETEEAPEAEETPETEEIPETEESAAVEEEIGIEERLEIEETKTIETVTMALEQVADEIMADDAAGDFFTRREKSAERLSSEAKEMLEEERKEEEEGVPKMPQMKNLYRKFVESEYTREKLREVIQLICTHPKKGAMLWHCTEGKDRCGIVSAIFLYILDFDMETIFEDYLFTNKTAMFKAWRFYAEVLIMSRSKEQAEAMRDAFLAKEEYLSEFFKAIEEHYGSIDIFVRDELGVTQEMKDALKAYCLE